MARSTDAVPGTTVAHLNNAVRRQWTWVVGFTLIGLALGLLAAGLLSRSYSASSTLTINPITSSLFATGPLAQQVNTATEAQVMASGEVRALAAEKLADGTTPEVLNRALTVSIPTESLALTATTTAPTAEESVRRADAMGDAYLAYRRAQAEAQIRVFLKRVDDRIAELEKALANKPANAASLSAELTSLRRDQSEALTLVVNPGSVIQRASLPGGASWPRLLTLAAAGAAFGFLVGVGVVVWRDRRQGILNDLEEMTLVAPQHPPQLSEALPLSMTYQEFVEGQWDEDGRDEVLALRVAVSRLSNDEQPVVVIGPAAVASLAHALDAAVAQVPQRPELGRSTVLDATGAPKGAASVAAAQAGVLVIAAVQGRTSKREIAQLAAPALGVTQASTPVVHVLVETTD